MIGYTLLFWKALRKRNQLLPVAASGIFSIFKVTAIRQGKR
jgi:hypothetical protein